MFWPWKKTAPAAAPIAEPDAALVSDVGCHRQLNEDSGRIVRAGVGKRGARGLLLVVADGMGGHEAGEVASGLAADTIAREYPQAKGTPKEALDSAFRQAHANIRRKAASDAAMSNMGTTCTAIAIVGERAWAAHVGDSRLYLVRGGEIYQLSEDQTQCMAMVRQGLLTIEEARRHEDRNVLISAMGTRKELNMVSWDEAMVVRPGDRFVLCSDGLHDLVNDGEIRTVVANAAPQSACERLVKMARERGGYDNITVAIAAVASAEKDAPSEDPGETRVFEVGG